MKNRRLFIAAITMLGLAGIIPSPRLSVTRIIDGDTFVVSDGRHIRMIGIDSPEKDQCYAAESTHITQTILLNTQVILHTDINGKDRFGRTLAYVYTDDGIFINHYLLQHGAGIFFYDTVNQTHTRVLMQAAEQARIQQKGLWTSCGPCIIKGNYDTEGRRWYHLPHFRHYPQVTINLDHGDRWFCTEEDARQEGFTRARE